MIEVSRETGKEFFYHCRPKCQKLGGWQLAARLHGAIDVYSGFAYEGQRETA
jgi:hypothetical protein